MVSNQPPPTTNRANNLRPVVLTRLDIPFGNIFGHTFKVLIAFILASIILSPLIASIVMFVMFVFAAIVSGGGA